MPCASEPERSASSIAPATVAASFGGKPQAVIASVMNEPIAAAGIRRLDSAVVTTFGSTLRNRDFEREVVAHLVALVGDDEGMAEENAEHAVGGNRIGLRHDDHAGLEHLFERLRRNMLGDDVRLIGDEVDAVALGRARLDALVAEELAGLPDLLAGVAGTNLGDDLLVAGQRDLI